MKNPIAAGTDYLEKVMLKKAVRKAVPPIMDELVETKTDFAKVILTSNEIVFGTKSHGKIKIRRTENDLSKLHELLPNAFKDFIDEKMVRELLTSIFVDWKGDDIEVKINSPKFGILILNYKTEKVWSKKTLPQ